MKTDDPPQSAATDDDRDTGSPAGSPRGRLLVSAFIMLTLVAVGTIAMPDSVPRNAALTATRPYLGATGLDQNWGVFAPDPRMTTSFVLTRIDRADGSSVMIPHPEAAGLTDYWDYRWRTFLTQIAPKDQGADRVAYARWVAARDRDAGYTPVRVSLVRRVARLLPPGPGPDQGPWTEQVLLSLDVTR